MTVQNSVAVRNAQLDAIETAIGTTPKFQFYTGDQPASCASAATGTKLVEIPLASDWASAASGGSKAFSGVPLTTTALAGGTCGHYRIVDAAGTTCHEQGAVAQNWAPNTAYALSAKRANGGKIYQCTTAGTSAGSGGPTGTGTGISDGTAVWSYVTTADMTIDNAVLEPGQAVQVTGFTKTAPGA